jgi:hypothetical protein
MIQVLLKIYLVGRHLIQVCGGSNKFVLTWKELLFNMSMSVE